jgi:hypothetical protein
MWWLLPAVIAAGTTASAEDPQGASREELVERWDLDGNGTIDESEAVLARSRMRRARRELEMQSSIDPLTGRPRDLDAETAEPVEEPKAPPPPPPRRRSPEEPPLPGTRVPDMKRPATPERPVPPSAGQNSGSRIRTPDSRRPAASRTPTPSPRSGSVVGGVRAGAPAARPGYGAAVPFSDLNAGRSRVASGPMPEQASRAARGRLSGGLVPSPVLPPTADGLARGGRYTGRPAGSPPVAPTPTLPRPPRMTAEDIGGP